MYRPNTINSFRRLNTNLRALVYLFQRSLTTIAIHVNPRPIFCHIITQRERQLIPILSRLTCIVNSSLGVLEGIHQGTKIRIKSAEFVLTDETVNSVLTDKMEVIEE